MELANKYKWLIEEKAPRILVEALKLTGTKETIGAKDNPVILEWADKVGLKNSYNKDEIPWCGLFIAYVCHVSGIASVINPLWARNWAQFGTRQAVAMLGDVLVFVRNGGGHVGLYVGEDKSCYHVLGGNQSDMVCITRIDKKRCIAIRRTHWKVAQPANVRVVKLDSSGAVSQNES
jgi:uncharacterized protein (TIGR02594 family)